ncbi:MAG: ABC transporter permease [Kiritimatiellia bacterium]
MNLWRVMAGEIGYRKMTFVLGCVSAAVAVGAITCSTALLRGHDLRTEKLIEIKEAKTRAEMAKMEDDYRVIMKRMGYNVMILHKDQDVAELHTLGYPSVTMPEAYAENLAAAGLPTLNHLLPILQKRVLWPETGEKILLTGVRGQMQLPGRKGGRAPIMAPIPDGHVALGNAIAARVDVTAGEKITLMGEVFKVERVEAARGTGDDMAVWVGLAKTQGWLREPGRINGILALECVCHAEALGQIVEQVTGVLPDTQVFEFTSKVQGRAEARKRATETRQTALQAELEQRLSLRGERQRLMAAVQPLAVAGAGLWMLLLAYGNTRERRSEIGMLRAIGVREKQILAMFLGKAALMGLAGGVAGIAIGLAVGFLASGVAAAWREIWWLAGGGTILLVFMMGPLLGCLATLWPAVRAARQDPADVLGEE